MSYVPNLASSTRTSRMTDKQKELILQTCRYCVELVREMPDFSGRTSEDPRGGMEGILRSEACDLLSKIDPEDILKGIKF